MEVWNEPDQPTEDYFAGPEKPQRYRSHPGSGGLPGDQGRPTRSMTVLAGSLVGSNGVFLRALYAAGIKGYYDGLSVHFYTLDARLAARDPRSAARQRRLTPLWLNEFGWTSC